MIAGDCGLNHAELVGDPRLLVAVEFGGKHAQLDDRYEWQVE
jgi:hypothetical protein